MGIIFDEKEKVFLLHTPNTTYAMAIVDDVYVAHVYYERLLKVQIFVIFYGRMNLLFYLL